MSFLLFYLQFQSETMHYDVLNVLFQFSLMKLINSFKTSCVLKHLIIISKSRKLGQEKNDDEMKKKPMTRER